MSSRRADIAKAEADAAAAKARVEDTLARLRLRLDPSVRARETWEDVRVKGETLADDALEFAYEKPGVIAGVAGAGTLLLLRRPIVRLVRWVFRPRRPKWDKKEVRRINPAGQAAAGSRGD